MTSAYHSGVNARATQGSVGDKTDGARQGREVLPAGTKVGRYELIRLVGEGGMGTVYEATDTRLGRKVALKVLSGNIRSKRKAAKRFAIEAKAAARLDHPNVVAIYDFDIDCEYPFMAMELLQGETLAEAIARGPMGFEALADVMLAVCAGVFAAHQAGIVHRDLKPSNIFLCRDWDGTKTARVLDFGISKVGGIASSALTQTGDIVGTSQYLSPEQASGGRHVNELCDQYSLGVVMYECVTQETPQRGQVIYTLLRNIAEGRHRPPGELRKDLPPALEAVIERAMMVRPRDRFPSVVDLARSLYPFASADGQRRYADFCGPSKSPGQSPEGVPPSVAEASSGAFLPPTERLPAPSPKPWQRQTTRTSLRFSGSMKRRHSGEVPVAISAEPSRARRMVVSIALGATLALIALLVIALCVRG